MTAAMTRPATAADYEAFVPLFGALGLPDPVPSQERNRALRSR